MSARTWGSAWEQRVEAADRAAELAALAGVAARVLEQAAGGADGLGRGEQAADRTQAQDRIAAGVAVRHGALSEPDVAEADGVHGRGRVEGRLLRGGDARRGGRDERERGAVRAGRDDREQVG